MPSSFVIYCHPEVDLSKRAYIGSGLHDGFLLFLSQLDSEVAQGISGSKTIPFTLSPLFGKVDRGPVTKEMRGIERLVRERDIGHEGFIKAETPCRLRTSFLDDSIGKRVEEILREPSGGISLTIGGIPLRITDAVFSRESGDPWVSRKSYDELYDNASPTKRSVLLQFVTSTAFKRGGGNLPLPDPQMAFRGYLDHWRWFSFLPFSSDFMEVIEQSILLADFNISPVSREMDYGKEHGFTGWCRFLLAGRHHERHIREFNVLADYAYYCGTGRNTSLGMGVTRRVRFEKRVLPR
ncbi:MAG: CRISPR system precrRNA processing endoribonuclease RAMP protein Cas6 [Thermodesulfobacteriota bacterium]